MEYILWPAAKILGLPWWILSQAAGYPVEVIDQKDLLPKTKDWVSFAERAAVYPVLNYESTTGFVGGVGFNDNHFFSRGIGLKIKAWYSTNTYRYAAMSVGGRSWGGRPYGLTAEIGWQAKTRERFFGIGPQSDEKDLTNYGYRGPFGTLAGHWNIAAGLNATAFIAIERIAPEDGRWVDHPYRRNEIKTLFPDQDLLGLTERVDLAEYGFGMEGNWLTRPGSPLAAGYGWFHLSYVTGSTENDLRLGYWKFKGEYGHYINLFRGRVIGLRIRTERTDPNDGTHVPFYRLAKLGGSSSLRGYNDGRFVDRDLLEFTFEYRWPLWRKLDAFIFTDQGRVFHDIVDDFAFSNFRSSYGGGLRLWQATGNSSVSIAAGSEATMFYFRMGSL